VRSLVGLELGKGLTLVEETVDLQVDLLKVEQVGERGDLHVERAG
jgi:hypothetical protein